jgi:hypothetical protein
MSFPKHEQKPKRSKRAPQSQPASQQEPLRVEVTGPDGFALRSMQHDINHVAGLDDVATHLDWIGDAVARLTHDDSTVGLAVCQNRYGGPVQVTLTDEDGNSTLDRLVTALERIADSVAKLAGLTRPRLEPWHEQDTYEPRFKDIAVDGGAPGPKTDPRGVDALPHPLEKKA